MGDGGGFRKPTLKTLKSLIDQDIGRHTAKAKGSTVFGTCNEKSCYWTMKSDKPSSLLI